MVWFWLIHTVLEKEAVKQMTVNVEFTSLITVCIVIQSTDWLN